MIIFWFKWYPKEKLHLGSFCSGNFTHFHSEHKKSNRNRIIHERNRENQTRTEQYVNKTERAKISISPMSDNNDSKQFQVICQKPNQSETDGLFDIIFFRDQCYKTFLGKKLTLWHNKLECLTIFSLI